MGKENGGADLVGSDVSLCGYLGLQSTKDIRELHEQLQPTLNRLQGIIREVIIKR